VTRRAFHELFCRQIPKDDVKLLSEELLLHSAAFFESVV
jgi:hypothetical protein